jgi:hypothetical protein
MPPLRSQRVAFGEDAFGFALRGGPTLAQIERDAVARGLALGGHGPRASGRPRSRPRRSSSARVGRRASARPAGRPPPRGGARRSERRDRNAARCRAVALGPGGEALGLGGVEAVGGGDEVEAEPDGIAFGEVRDRGQGELAVRIVDLVEELDLVGRSAQSPHELSAAGVESPQARQSEHQETLDLALARRAVLAARLTGEIPGAALFFARSIRHAHLGVLDLSPRGKCSGPRPRGRAS